MLYKQWNSEKKMTVLESYLLIGLLCCLGLLGIVSNRARIGRAFRDFPSDVRIFYTHFWRFFVTEVEEADNRFETILFFFVFACVILIVSYTWYGLLLFYYISKLLSGYQVQRYMKSKMGAIQLAITLFCIDLLRHLCGPWWSMLWLIIIIPLSWYLSFCLGLKNHRNKKKKKIKMPSLFQYLVLTTSLFCLGLFGIVSNRANLLIILMCVEVVLFSIDINFVIFSVYLDDIVGQVFALFVLTVASSESAIGLAIVVVYYRLIDNIVIHPRGLLRG